MTTLITTLTALLFLPAGPIPQPPADILIEWVDVEPEAVPLEGESGTTTEVKYRVRNIGGTDAYAVLIRSYTALGPLGPSIRLRPGPRAGRDIERTLTVPLARGMRELCIEGRLQALDSTATEDPSPQNNRACRPIRIVDRRATFNDSCFGGAAP
jgi:hypothetical protein